MDNATFVRKVIDALQVEASRIARNPHATAPYTYTREYNLDKTIEELDALVDELEAALVRAMSCPTEVTDAGYRRACEIRDTVLHQWELHQWELTKDGWIQR